MRGLAVANETREMQPIEEFVAHGGGGFTAAQALDYDESSERTKAQKENSRKPDFEQREIAGGRQGAAGDIGGHGGKCREARGSPLRLGGCSAARLRSGRICGALSDRRRGT